MVQGWNHAGIWLLRVTGLIPPVVDQTYARNHPLAFPVSLSLTQLVFELQSLVKDGEEYEVLCAIGGVPVVPFRIHVEEFLQRGEKEFLALCARQAQTLAEKFGDRRYQTRERLERRPRWRRNTTRRA